MKKTYWKKMAVAVAAVVMGLQLAGCGGAEGNTTAQKEYVYVPEYHQLELEEGMDQVAIAGDMIYFRTGSYDEEAGSYTHQLGTLKMGETTPKIVPLEVEMNAYISGLGIDTDGNVQTLVTTQIYEENTDAAEESVESTNEATDESGVEAETNDSETGTGNEQTEADEIQAGETEIAEAGTVAGTDVNEETIYSEETTESTVIIGDSSLSTTLVGEAEWIAGEDYQMPVGTKLELLKYDTEGKLISRVDLTEALDAEGEIYVQYLESDKDGNLYLGGEQAVWVLDQTGKQICKLELEDWLYNMFSTKDGRVMAVYYGAESIEVHPVDVEARKFGDAIENVIVADYGNYTFAKGGNTDLLFNVDNELYTYNFGDDAPTKVLNWIDCDIDTDQLQTFAMLEDGRIMAVTSTWNDEGKSEAELIYLTKKKGSEVPEKKILTLGTMLLDYDVRKQVIEFNKTNQEYRIEVKEYFTETSADGYEAGLEQMNADIVSGKCPDLVDLSISSMQSYVAKGILADLYPFMDRDEEINREDYLENVLHAFEVDGKLYAFPQCFYISTIMGKQSDFGDRQSITLDELMDMTAGMPEDVELYEDATKDSILMWNTMMNMDQYVNWDTGECKFNSEEFMKALEFANSFEQEITFDEEDESMPAKLREGKLLMINSSISSTQEYQMYAAMFGEPVAFVGYPTDKENGSFIFGGGTLLAISAKSPYQEGAWQFVRRGLTKEAQESESNGIGFGFPVMKSALEKQFAKDMEDEYYEDVDGSKQRQPKTTWGYDDFTVEIYAATEEEVAVVRNLIEHADTVFQYDEQMLSIISEEAAAFFEGQKTVKEVADVIQSRVQIYVNENR